MSNIGDTIQQSVPRVSKEDRAEIAAKPDDQKSYLDSAKQTYDKVVGENTSGSNKSLGQNALDSTTKAKDEGKNQGSSIGDSISNTASSVSDSAKDATGSGKQGSS